MEDISIVKGGYKPTYKWGAPSCMALYQLTPSLQCIIPFMTMSGPETIAKLVYNFKMVCGTQITVDNGILNQLMTVGPHFV